MTPTAQKSLKFGRFTIDPNAARVCGDNGPLSLRPKAFDVLVYLARHPGRIVTKDELIESVWPNVFVTDNSLVQCISDIRAALDDDDQKILKTVARRGYLFAASVVESEPQPIATAGVGASVAVRDDLPNAAATPAARRWPVSPLIAGPAVIAVAAAGAAWWSWQGTSEVAPASSKSGVVAPTQSNRATVAVLPFAAPAAPAGDEYFADGLTEDIIAALGRFGELSVLSPKAVFAYKDKALRPDEMGRALKARSIAGGSVRRSSDRFRIAVGLPDAAVGTLLWSDQYDAEPARIFAIQDDITRRMAGALAVRLTNVEQARVAAKPP